MTSPERYIPIANEPANTIHLRLVPNTHQPNFEVNLEALAWQDGGAECRGSNAEKFFLVLGASASAVKAAKAICAGCNIQPECLEWALENNEPDGIWGGATVKERRRLREARALASISLGQQ